MEQDPEQILEAVVDAVDAVLRDVNGRVVACGIDYQGDSVLAWDAGSGTALSPILVWQDKRSESVLGTLSPKDATSILDLSGLPIDPYFSARIRPRERVQPVRASATRSAEHAARSRFVDRAAGLLD